jgi:DNA repair protein RadC
MAIKDWPETERPREKLLQLGARALSDAELLAIFLRTGTRGRSAVDLAHALLVQFGGLRPLLLADQRRFCAGMGLGEAKYVQLQAVLELARRHLSAQVVRGDALSSPDATRDFLSAQLRDREQEVFACLFLDNRHRVVAFDEMFYGTVDRAEVHPREVVKRALHHNAAALILAHNHPSGVPEPSRADERITIRLKNALDLIDVRVLDHFIVGDGCVTSLSERGLL